MTCSRLVACVLAGSFVGLSFPASALAQKSAAVREAAEYVMERFGREAAEETVESVASKLTRLCAKHGDEAIVAVKKVGPRAFKLVEEAGEQGPSAIKLMVRYGDEAAWVISQPKRLAIFIEHGDDAAEAMIKHKDIVLPLLERYKGPAAQAFKAVDGQSARRLAMMEKAGELAKLGRTDGVLTTVARYGDKGADFVWRNKGALAVGAALTAFLADPEPFIAGSRDLANVVGDVAKEPLREAARGTNWTIVALSVLAVLFAIAGIKLRRRLFKPHATTSGPNDSTGTPVNASTTTLK